MKRLPVHERFLTFQGEGMHSGRAAFFIRTYGCPVHCPWCDSAGTWHPDWVPSEVQRMTPEELVAEVTTTAAPIVVVTGGEPAIHDLAPLVAALHGIDRAVHIETSGHYPLRATFDWVTVSPKRWAMPLPSNVTTCDELKVIVEAPYGPGSIEWWEGELRRGMTEHPLVRLHPEWSQRRNPAVLRAIADAVTHNPRYRAGWQLHKLYQVDALDERSQPAVPLGGVGGPST
jgi:7-carboxy-7-deazaguanine synthase